MNSLMLNLIGFGLIITFQSSSEVTCWHDHASHSSELITQQQKKEISVKTVYTCPMHPEVVQDKAGKCAKCGMDLISKKEVKKDVYTCPMHSEVVQEKSGKCPKCGMDLALKEPAKKSEKK